MIDSYTTLDDLTASGTLRPTDHPNVYVHGDHSDIRARRNAWRVIVRTSDHEYVTSSQAFRTQWQAQDHVMLISTIL